MEHWKNLSLDDIEGEIWKDIPDLEFYMASNYGRIKSKTRKVKSAIKNNPYTNRYSKIISQYLMRNGRLKVVLTIKDKNYNFMVHSLVAKSFYMIDENRKQVNHLDCNPLNNCAINLQWTNQKENIIYARDLGRLRKTYSIKPIIKCDINGNFISEHKTISDCMRSMGKKIHSSISDCCKGKIKSYCGFTFKYK